MTATKISEMSTLFIVEDNEIDQYILKFILKREPVFNAVCYFNQSLPVLAHLKDHACEDIELPDAIILDLNIPDLNGWDFLHAFQKIYPTLCKKIAVYIVTASIFPKDKNKARQYDFVREYISKPVTKDHLIAIANSLQSPAKPNNHALID